MINRQACSAQQRISKSTVLAMLQAPSTLGINPGESVQYTEDSGQTHQLRVIRAERDTVTLATSNGPIVVSRSKVKNNAPPVFLDNIPLDHWSVTSFDPRTRVVCISIITPSGTRNVTATLPVIDMRTPGQ